MARPKVLHAPKQHATKEVILDILRAGAEVVVEMLEDSQELRAYGVVRQWLPSDERYYPSSIDRQLTRLWRKGYVDIRKTDDGHVVSISSYGKTEVLRYDLSHMEIKTQRHWDRKWRMVIFDIPKEKESIRGEFRKHLMALGFFQMQKSVYVHPFPCEREVQYLREIYDIPHSVKLATLEKLENDRDLRDIFRL